MSKNIDQIDRDLLRALQRDGSLSQRDLAERVGLSQNACWRRLKALQDKGILRGTRAEVDRSQLDLGLVVFVMLRTRHHSAEWLAQFRRHVLTIPEVVDFHRIGGDYDYQLKVVTRDMASYDKVYQRLIAGVELDSVTSYFAMEAIAEGRPLPV
ncbi:Transcriptional regulator, AsnC family [Tritonibacter mobilis]|jgi:Lrp/AsnC family transcriptional regulator|uniref:Transcriptional regulator n=1 Tax=Tritonibacter mobilis F1926 TaxID=1265309 RepID=A0A1B0ZZV0_9RHOB|nr:MULTISPECIES: Lrp/AsnC family transcriptional regulator [Tritonibacter]EEW59605.1 glutamate uptake regulatory protein [Ruegeria sp. TrichCH4B]MBW3243813.1 Lrp/AsnC family transcriptional regulator [Epibacterium sp. DP7N7-1]MCZ4267217.1 Lrp/AsnC family transcriptional regulator [Rhodobacteraceae bacterium G21628-S1]MEE2810703.1 Lrp/AsnC family transcriptional regulator [Pseudomonadota bacterium]NKX38585.1 Lrp/AsnC family transcriptional regulator [Rhodobacteraceae bacterium R_SAG5]PXW77467.